MIVAGVAALVGACGLWVYRAANIVEEDEPELHPAFSKKQPVPPRPPWKGETLRPPRPSPFHDKGKPKTRPGKDFLEAFGKSGTEPDDAGPTPDNAELEKKFHELARLDDRMRELEAKLAMPTTGPAGADEIGKQLDRLEAELNRKVVAFEKEMARARKSRPGDPVPQWLTGELLMFVRGEPELILPFFQRARDGGLDTPRLWASLSRVQVEANQFEQGYHSGGKAIRQGVTEPYPWNAFTRAAFCLNEFVPVRDRLDTTFKPLPTWAAQIRREAVALETLWQAELKLRRQEETADDLPRVKLVIDHRRFVTENGKINTKVESSGKGEVILELFEDQAPNTVANFITLVEKKFYDGTKFFLSEPASLAAGGCPMTRNADPADDGTGGPGYCIPDEFGLPNARCHFRGSLSMVNESEPDSAGCQFMITLVPQPRMNRLFTVFGRVIQGQEVVDRISQGRTNLEVAPFGRIIPGDVIVRAEVLRKRAHPYRVKKVEN
jgi:cyclophilin family peptidyl-prolyl cis-trans isomerase